MKINCAYEHNGDDTLLHIIECVGAYTRGQNIAIAFQKVIDEVKSYNNWLGINNDEIIEVNITEEKDSNLLICDADSDMIFRNEYKPLTRIEYETLKVLALKSANDFQKMYQSISNKDLLTEPGRVTFYGQVPRSAREMYEHVRNVNSYYFGEVGITIDNDGDIYQIRQKGFELLEKIPSFLDNVLFIGSCNEEWTVRKMLRRFVWHDRIHAKAMYRMATKLSNKIDNTFKFGGKK